MIWSLTQYLRTDDRKRGDARTDDKTVGTQGHMIEQQTEQGQMAERTSVVLVGVFFFFFFIYSYIKWISKLEKEIVLVTGVRFSYLDGVSRIRGGSVRQRRMN